MSNAKKNAVGLNARSVLALTSGGVGVQARPGDPRSVGRTGLRQGAVEEPQVVRRKETFNLDVELMDEFRDAVTHLSGPPLFLGLSETVEEALRRELKRLQHEYHEGTPFPKRPRELKRGRRTGAGLS